MKNKIVELLRTQINTKITFGSITKVTRQKFGLAKHQNTDAKRLLVFIQKRQLLLYKIRQVRKKKRSLHEQIPRKGRKEPNRTANRTAPNTKEIIVGHKKWCLWDKV